MSIIAPELAARFAPLSAFLRREVPTGGEVDRIVASPLIVLDAPPPCETPVDGPNEPAASEEFFADDPEPAAILTDPELLAMQIRCFRARLEDMLADATRRLAADLAAEVLGRELELAPAAIDAIAKRLLADFWDERPLRLRVSGRDAAALRIDAVAVVVDPDLRPGDCVIEVAGGAYESTLGIRLAAVAERLG